MKVNANLKLKGISVSLDALSSICDMVERFNVEELTGAMKTGEEENDEDIDDIVSDASDTLSDLADEMRDGIEEITDQLEEIKDALSM